MRRRAVVVVAVLLLSCSVVFAQSNRVSLYLSNPGLVGGDHLGTHYTGGAALSVTHFWTPRFATELVAGAERDYRGVVFFNRDGSVRETREFGYTRYPIDVLAQYHFRTDSRVRPYVGAGMRYSNRPGPYLTGSTYAAELNGGMLVMLKPRLALVVDARVSDSGTRWFPDFRPSAGLGWRF